MVPAVDSLRQTNSPAVLVAIHAQDHVCYAWRVIDRVIKHQEIRSHLGDSYGMSVQEQSHPNVC